MGAWPAPLAKRQAQARGSEPEAPKASMAALQSARQRATTRRGAARSHSDERQIWRQLYRVTHLLANLGWVDFDLGSFPACLGSR